MYIYFFEYKKKTPEILFHHLVIIFICCHNRLLGLHRALVYARFI